MIQCFDRAVKPRRGQVQRGNTCQELDAKASGVLFTAVDAL
jgi:hypothetical protein